jgi:hypothetical protein
LLNTVVLSVVMLHVVVMLSVSNEECHYVECLYAEYCFKSSSFFICINYFIFVLPRYKNGTILIILLIFRVRILPLAPIEIKLQKLFLVLNSFKANGLKFEAKQFKNRVKIAFNLQLSITVTMTCTNLFND